MSETQPVPVVVDGAQSRLAKVIVRAAAERSDVTVAAVVGSAQWGDSDNYLWLLNHDSTYGPSDITVPYVTDGRELAGQHNDAVIVSVGTSAEATVQAFGDDNELPAHTIVTNAQTWQAARKDWQPLGVIGARGHREELPQGRPLYVPSARWGALFPLMCGVGAGWVEVVETASLSEEGASLDNGARARTLAEARTVMSGTVIHTDRTMLPGGDSQPDPTSHIVEFPHEIEDLFHREQYRETLLSVAAPVGSLAVLSLAFTARPHFIERKFLTLSRSHQPVEAPFVSTVDVKKSSTAFVSRPDITSWQSYLNPHNPRFNHVRTIVQYDADWFRASRILDTAVELAQR